MKKTGRKTKWMLAGVLLAALIVTCYTNPAGRKALMLVTPAQEAQLGLSAFDEIKQSTPRTTDSAQQALVERVGRKISAVVSLPNAQWEYVCFKADDTPNAFCLPSGKIGIYTGILPITQNEAGLATVMAHEVSHAVARHGGERISEGLVMQLGGIGLDVALQKEPETTRQIALTAYGLGAQLGRTLPHSRSQELEADKLGLMYMAKAGYDPHEAIAFWKRFKTWNDQRGGGSTPEFLSTHPVDSRRIAQLESLLPEAMKYYRK
ncbi:M48 family metallopeptidase [bacterium]|nr:M48 family metallopeptidase [bacterium]